MKRMGKEPFGMFLSFLPAASDKATKRIRDEIRSWRIAATTHISINDIAARINSKVRVWINDYGRFYGSHFKRKAINLIVIGLERWAMRKYKSLKRRPKRARAWLSQMPMRDPDLFSHCELTGINDGTTGAV